MDDRYTASIGKADLEHGAYYVGHCRNAKVARWDAHRQQFRHWRRKWGSVFMEYIRHPEDEKHFDVFVVVGKLNAPPEVPIPLEDAP